MRSIYIRSARISPAGANLTFNMSPLDVWHFVPGSKKLNSAKKPRKLFFPAQYDLAEIAKAMEKLPRADRSVEIEVSEPPEKVEYTIMYKRKGYTGCNKGLLPLKQTSKPFNFDVEASKP